MYYLYETDMCFCSQNVVDWIEAGGQPYHTIPSDREKLKNQLPNGNALKFLLSLYSKYFNGMDRIDPNKHIKILLYCQGKFRLVDPIFIGVKLCCIHSEVTPSFFLVSGDQEKRIYKFNYDGRSSWG